MTPEKQPQEGAPEEKLSMREVLATKKREAKKAEEAAATAAAERAATELRETEEREGAALKQQITELAEKKKRLEELVTKIQEAYAGVDTAVGDFKEADKEIKEMMKEYKDVLASPLEEGQEPINTKKRNKPDAEGGGEEPHYDFRDELVNSEQADNFKETAGFKEKQQTLREKIAAVLAEKENIQKELPEVDLTVESSKKEGKDNEEVVVSKLKDAITKLQKEIAELTEKSPERKKEKEKVSECKTRLESALPFCRVPIKGDAGQLTAEMLRTMSLFISDSRVPSYVNEYGEEAYKEAIFDLILPNFIKIMAGPKSAELPEEKREKLEEMLRAKIDRDVAEQVLNSEERNAGLHSAKDQLEKSSYDTKMYERALGEVKKFRTLPAYEELKDKVVKIKDTRHFGTSKFGSGELKVFDMNGENHAIASARLRIAEANTKAEEVRNQISALKKPFLNFGEAARRYEQTMDGLNRELTRYSDRVRETNVRLNEDLRHYQMNPSVNLGAVAYLIEKSTLKGEDLLAFSETGKVEDIVDKMEEQLKAKSEQKPSPLLGIKTSRYQELNEELERADREYKSKIVYSI